jgi:hypothetical protein
MNRAVVPDPWNRLESKALSYNFSGSASVIFTNFTSGPPMRVIRSTPRPCPRNRRVAAAVQDASTCPERPSLRLPAEVRCRRGACPSCGKGKEIEADKRLSR